MSDNAGNLNGKISLDTTDYKAQVAIINREIRLVESGFRASAAALGDWSKSADGVEQRTKALTKEIELQEKKVGALSDEYKRLSEDPKASARAMEELQIKINKETEALNKNKVELAGMPEKLNALGESTQKAGDKTEESGRKMENFKTVMSGVGAVAKGVVVGMMAVATAAVATVGMLATLIIKGAEYSGNLTDMSTKTGISVGKLQELAFVGKQVGVDLETMTGSLSKLTRNMDAARGGQGDAAEAFKALGVNVTDANGQLRDSETVWQESLTALGNVGNETERDALAMKLFGKSAMELNPLIKTSGEEMDKMTQLAREMGAVMSDEDVAAGDKLGDTLDALKMGITGIGYSIAASFMPGFQNMANGAGGYLTRLNEVVKGSGGDIGKMAAGIGGIAGDIAANIAKDAPKMLKAGLGMVKGLITAILQALPTIVTSAVEIINALVGFLVEMAPMLAQAIPPLITTLLTAIITQLPMLLTAGLQIIVQLALGIAQSLPTLIPTIVTVMLQLVQTLIDNLPMLVNAAIQLILALVQGLIAALPILIEQAPVIIQSLVDAIVVALPMLLEATIKLIAMLVTGILDNLPKLVESGAQIIVTIVKAITSKENWEKLLSVGKNVVDGVWQGIKDSWEKFKAKVSRMFIDLVGGINAALQINSPSKVFARIGSGMVEGLDKGFSSEMKGFERKVESAMRGLSTGFEFNAGFAGAGGYGGTNDNSFTMNSYAPIIVQAGNSGELAEQLKSKRF